MHVSLPVGSSTLMGSDSCSAFGPPPVVGSNFAISLVGKSREHCDEVFAGLSEGRHGQDADARDVLGRLVRHLDGSVRRELDDQLRAAEGVVPTKQLRRNRATLSTVRPTCRIDVSRFAAVVVASIAWMACRGADAWSGANNRHERQRRRVRPILRRPVVLPWRAAELQQYRKGLRHRLQDGARVLPDSRRHPARGLGGAVFPPPLAGRPDAGAEVPSPRRRRGGTPGGTPPRTRGGSGFRTRSRAIRADGAASLQNLPPTRLSRALLAHQVGTRVPLRTRAGRRR